MIDASEVLSQLRPGVDMVVKGDSRLPFVERGSDIDVFTLDPGGLEARIARNFPIFDFEEMRVSNLSPRHIQISFSILGELGFMLDVYGDFPNYSRFNIKPELFHRLVASSANPAMQTSKTWPVPSTVSEAVIRYLEYINFFWSGPSKIKHAEWVLENLTDSDYELFFWTLHKYVQVKEDFLVQHNKVKAWRSTLLFLVTRLQENRVTLRIGKKVTRRFPRFGSFIESLFKG